jgi:hypothetical protein
MCDDIDGCKRMTLKTNASQLLVFKIIIKSMFNFFPVFNGQIFRSLNLKNIFEN